VEGLTPSLFPCYASADRELADCVASFLERGAEVRVFLDEGEMREGEDLASKAREGRMADAILVLFSRASLPPRWPRSRSNSRGRSPAISTRWFAWVPRPRLPRRWEISGRSSVCALKTSWPPTSIASAASAWIGECSLFLRARPARS
jgi:hypothetical protein